MRLRRPRSKGYTLLEVLVALVISSIGLLGLAQLQIVATRSNSFSNQMTMGITLAKDQLEAFHNVAYDDAQLAAGNHLDPANPLTTQTGISFNRRWTVALDAVNKLKTITVTVGWPVPSESHRVQFTTVRTE
jgi:prepilin-type N-terminal cleavage/methylation domain-containing protein